MGIPMPSPIDASAGQIWGRSGWLEGGVLPSARPRFLESQQPLSTDRISFLFMSRHTVRWNELRLHHLPGVLRTRFKVVSLRVALCPPSAYLILVGCPPSSVRSPGAHRRHRRRRDLWRPSRKSCVVKESVLPRVSKSDLWGVAKDSFQPRSLGLYIEHGSGISLSCLLPLVLSRRGVSPRC
ncbi:uncharacterized protein BJX67DRAFT_209796 [Aspergillus lucknowensis]|uniref:Uncharacterized protein n=1 Tax=Aspergillus lucknowensis TaxID=176173 RepID=A0ABR4M277_9EURO